MNAVFEDECLRAERAAPMRYADSGSYLPVGVVINVGRKEARTVFHLQSYVNDFFECAGSII